MSNTNIKYIGYWIPRKKYLKINWVEFQNICNEYNYELKEVNLIQPLESQGPFTVFLHKLTDILAVASQGDIESQKIIDRVEHYIKTHPDVIVIDPLDRVRILLDRCRTYNFIIESNLSNFEVYTPKFVQLESTNVDDNLVKLKNADIGYPFLCKSSIGHGSKKAHKMSIIFNEKYVSDCFKPPCVAQKFIPHNAILYKIFIVGDRYYIVERPSLKNFYECDRETIFFDSHNISKAASQSTLSVLDPEDLKLKNFQPELNVFKQTVTTLRNTLGMSLFGVDVIIENNSGKYYIIDINAYPGYDGYPDFYGDLLFCINQLVNKRSRTENTTITNDIDESDTTFLNKKYVIT